MCKHGSMEGEPRERAVQGRKVVGSLGHMMRGRTVSTEVKKGQRDGIIVLTMTYASETWVWNERQRSRIQAVEMSYLRSACVVQRMDGERYESVYNRFGMSSKGEGMKRGVVEGCQVQHPKVVWPHGKRVYMSMVDVVGARDSLQGNGMTEC